MTTKMYPENYPDFDYEPTSDKFEVVHCDEQGMGLISKTSFKAGDTVFQFTGEVKSEQSLYTLQLSMTQFVEDPYVMGRVLHSCDPNMEVDMGLLTFYATRDIKEGEYLTMDYETTEDELYQHFYCKCGADNCRGWIRGRNYLPN